jgi:hypothetical protein
MAPPADADASSGGSSSIGRRSASAPRERVPTALWRPASGRKLGAAASSFSIPPNMPCPVHEAKFHGKQAAAVKPFRPASGSRSRLSMWSPNPYAVDSRPAPSIDFTIT